MKRISLFVDVDMIRKLKRESKVLGFSSASALIRKILHDYFVNKDRPKL